MVDEFENDGFIINDLNDDEEGKPDIDDEKQKKRRKKRSKRNMVLDDDDYEVIEENNPGFHCHTSENCKRLKKVRTDVGALPLATIDNLFGADDGTFQISMLIIGCGFRMVVVVTGRSKGFDVGRALQARSFDFEEAISMVLYGINTLEEFHVTSTIRDVVGNIKTAPLYSAQQNKNLQQLQNKRCSQMTYQQDDYYMLLIVGVVSESVRLNIKLVQREGNAVLRRHLESLPLESFYLANESVEDSALQADFISLATLLLIRKVAFHKPYIRGLIANFAQLRDMPAEFIQMYCHIAAHKFFSLCHPVRRVLFEEFLYREARIKKILRINGVAPGK
ncbi:putative ion channel protein castor [Tanacetum coccineum]